MSLSFFMGTAVSFRDDRLIFIFQKMCVLVVPFKINRDFWFMWPFSVPHQRNLCAKVNASSSMGIISCRYFGGIAWCYMALSEILTHHPHSTSRTFWWRGVIRRRTVFISFSMALYGTTCTGNLSVAMGMRPPLRYYVRVPCCQPLHRVVPLLWIAGMRVFTLLSGRNPHGTRYRGLNWSSHGTYMRPPPVRRNQPQRLIRHRDDQVADVLKLLLLVRFCSG